MKTIKQILFYLIYWPVTLIIAIGEIGFEIGKNALSLEYQFKDFEGSKITESDKIKLRKPSNKPTKKNLFHIGWNTGKKGRR